MVHTQADLKSLISEIGVFMVDGQVQLADEEKEYLTKVRAAIKQVVGMLPNGGSIPAFSWPDDPRREAVSHMYNKWRAAPKNRTNAPSAPRPNASPKPPPPGRNPPGSTLNPVPPQPAPDGRRAGSSNAPPGGSPPGSPSGPGQRLRSPEGQVAGPSHAPPDDTQGTPGAGTGGRDAPVAPGPGVSAAGNPTAPFKKLARKRLAREMAKDPDLVRRKKKAKSMIDGNLPTLFEAMKNHPNLPHSPEELRDMKGYYERTGKPSMFCSALEDIWDAVDGDSDVCDAVNTLTECIEYGDMVDL